MVMLIMGSMNIISTDFALPAANIFISLALLIQAKEDYDMDEKKSAKILAGVAVAILTVVVNLTIRSFM